MKLRGRGRPRREKPPLLCDRDAYPLADLLAVSGMSRRRMMRVLRSLGVEMVREGRRWIVPRVELEGKASLLWESIKRVQRRRLEKEGRGEEPSARLGGLSPRLLVKLGPSRRS